MRALSASSKLSGYSDIGFALGMDYPPFSSIIARFSARTSCWHASPEACSAFCNHIIEQVRILSIVVTMNQYQVQHNRLILSTMRQQVLKINGGA